jgi:2-keto-4-pentenoate hydratase/2-oxohepta-3-ene-1,7-dioic acid hydratase in catechol pathway
LDYLITRHSDLKREIEMKLASFETENRTTYGILVGDTLREADDAFRTTYPDLRSAIAGGKLVDLEREQTGAIHALDSIKFLPLIPAPDKILCVGVNYRPHIEEMGRDVPDYPVVFVRFPGSQVGHEQSVIRPRVSEKFDFEGELAIVIGKPARHVNRDDALDYIAGYCCFMDGSVRVLMQEGQVADLVFGIPELIEYCSTFTELLPGDVIATGTPGGVGAARTPPVWLKVGDSVEVNIPGVGLLANSVANE